MNVIILAMLIVELCLYVVCVVILLSLVLTLEFCGLNVVPSG